MRIYFFYALKIICLALAFFSACSACNIFEWTYSAESSDDFELVITEAEILFVNQEYERAFALFDHACTLNSSSARAKYGRLQSRLLTATGGRPLLHVFEVLFHSALTNTDIPFDSIEQSEHSSILESLERSYGDVLFILNPELTDNSVATNTSRFLIDAALVSSAYAAMSLTENNLDELDSNTCFTVSSEFVLEQILPVPAGTSNTVSLWLSNTRVLLNSGRQFTIELLATDPVFSATNSSFWHFENNCRILYESIQTVRENIQEAE